MDVDDKRDLLLNPEFDFSDKCFLVTGVSGFLSKVFVEKLYRIFPAVKKIYLLIRRHPITNASAQERLVNEVLDSPIFEKINQNMKSREEALKKLVAIEGDMDVEDFGLSEGDKQTLLSSVDVVVHAAAESDWMAPLEVALRRNVTASLSLLNLAKNMINIKLFMYISSAFIERQITEAQGCTQVEECIYRLDFEPAWVCDYRQSKLKPEFIKECRRHLQSQYSNTHALTKAIVEPLLEFNAEHVPLIIIRPTFLGAVYEDPHTGFIDSLNIPTRLFLYTGLGSMDSIPGDPDCLANIVPCDYCVQVMLLAIRRCAGRGSTVLNVTARVPIKWRLLTQIMLEYWKGHNLNAVSPSIDMVKNAHLYYAKFFIKYQIPMLVYSVTSKFLSSDFHVEQTRKLNDAVVRSRRFASLAFYYLSRTFQFVSDNVQDLLTFSEHSCGDLESCDIDWYKFVYCYCWGIAKYISGQDCVFPAEHEWRSSSVVTRDLDGGRSGSSWFADVRFALFSSYNVQYPSYNDQTMICERVLRSERVLRAIHSECRRLSLPESLLVSRANEALNRMATMQKLACLRLLSWVFRKVWRNLYDSLQVNESALDKLADLRRLGPVIFVPSHKSYVDFLLISYVLFVYDFPVPLIAAGEDFLNMKLVSYLLRYSGAFFLRRSFRDDPLYQSVFNEYIQQLLASNAPLEFFIEGTRSRSGKLLKPKMGMMRTICDALFDGTVKHVSIVPININYEKVLEDELYINEWLGEKKREESLENLIKAFSIFKTRHGKISIKFGRVIPLESYVSTYGDRSWRPQKSLENSRVNMLNLIGNDGSDEKKFDENFDPLNNSKHRRDVVFALSNEVVYEIGRSTVWSPYAIISSVLLQSRFSGLKVSRLVSKVEAIISEVLKKDCGYYEWLLDRTAGEQVEKFLRVFQSHLTLPDNDTVSLKDSRSALVLAFYQNKLIHLFIKEAFLSLAYMTLLKDSKSQSVSFEQIIARANFISSFIGDEFVYKKMPLQPDRLDITLHEMIEAGWFCTVEGDDGIMFGAEHKWIIEYFANLICSFIDTYWISLMTFIKLKPSLVQQSLYVAKIGDICDKHYFSGEIPLIESRSRETIGCSIRSFVALKILRCDDSGHLMSLNTEFAAEDNLQHLFKQLTYCRLTLYNQNLQINVSNNPQIRAEFYLSDKLRL